MREYKFELYKNGSEIDNFMCYKDCLAVAMDCAKCMLNENCDKVIIRCGEDWEYDYVITND